MNWLSTKTSLKRRLLTALCLILIALPLTPVAQVTRAQTGGIVYQAEAASFGGGAAAESNNAGFNGSGFINFAASGSFLQFNNVNGGAGGSAILQFRYALGASGSRTGVLIVNGASQSITFNPTGAWTTWVIQSVTVPLNAGASNTVRLETNGQDLANIDQLEGPAATASPTPTRTPTRTNTPVGPTNTPTRTPVGPTLTPTRTNTQPTGSQVIQAESASFGGGAAVESNNAGFNGTGFINFAASGSFLQFNNVNGGTGGSQTLQFRYALGATASRTGVLIVNGTGQSITFTTTGAWTTWAIHSVNVNLNAGTGNTIRLETNGQDLANLDQLAVGGGTGPTPSGTPTRTQVGPTNTPTRTPVGPTLTPTRTPTSSQTRIFPGAQGFGVDSPAGRGGRIIKVTNLNASGPGSFREALSASGPRIIVFEVGGIIDLNRSRLDITEPFVTIAGQTAPSPGITLIRGGMRITTHDVLMKHIRFRMGDAGATSGFEPDVTTDGPNAYNIVIDHCSFTWGVDENLSVSGPRLDGPEGTSRRVTLSYNIIAEGLYDSIHSKGIHSMGTLIHDYVTDVAVIGNLFAHNDERNPWYKGFATGVIVNNLIYNPGRWPVRLGPVLSEWDGTGITPAPPRVSVVGNYMRYGVNTPSGIGMVGTNSIGSAYLEDNIALDRAGSPVPLTFGGVTILASRPSWPSGLVAMPANQVVNYLVAHAGARPQDRDSVDARIVAEFLASAGSFVDSQNDVGGYPTAAPTFRTLTVPATDIDNWLHSFSLALE